MGKISAVFILLLMIDIVGYILMTSAVDEGLAAGNPYITQNSLLTTFYSQTTLGSGEVVYVLDNESALYTNVPQETPSSLIQEGISFVDRIFILFGWVKALLGVILFPIALISFMGLAWQLSMLFFLPLMGLYIIGFIDLLSGGNN